jgi:hypothetical protein
LLSVLISSCASGPKTPKGKTFQFNTRISDSNLKHFELQYVSQIPESAPQAKKRPNAPTPPPKKLKKQMLKHAQKVVNDKQYCRQGFWILSFDIDLRGPVLRGECNDLANRQDREAFPSTIKNW